MKKITEAEAMAPRGLRVRVARRVFLAGASGVVGRRLVTLLNDAGHTVFGTTRREDRAVSLRDSGATPVILDVFDAAAVEAHPMKLIEPCPDNLVANVWLSHRPII